MSRRFLAVPEGAHPFKRKLQVDTSRSVYPLAVTSVIFGESFDQHQLIAVDRRDLMYQLQDQFEPELLTNAADCLESGHTVVFYYGGKVDSIVCPIRTRFLRRDRPVESEDV
jgi:DNA-binding MurR/RpiR family transcriptional regulator